MLFYIVGRRWWTRIRVTREALCFHRHGCPLLVRRD
jgi:hypothetical protein